MKVLDGLLARGHEVVVVERELGGSSRASTSVTCGRRPPSPRPGSSARRSDLEHPPRRDTVLAAGDDAYLAGPSEELLRVLERERRG